MFKTMKLQPKLLIIGCLLVIVPQIIIAAITLIQNKLILDNTVKETTRLAYTDLDHVAKSVYGLVEAQQQVNEKDIKNSLNVAREVVSNLGGFSFDDKTVRWDAVNQFTQQTSPLELPRMKSGSSWLGQVSDVKTSVPVVDRVHELVGVTCTVFQRMNAAGDMIRVATTVVKKDGTRAIGTFIPATDPDGKPDPVVSMVMRGETFVGRAYVVNDWYLAAYEPVRDITNKIIGMLYVGVPLEGIKSIRQTIMNIVVGKTGYVWVLDSKGHYVISDHGKRDGEDISGSKDANGDLFIQDMVKQAMSLKPGEIGEHQYPWQNPGEPKPRMKIARIMYFAPWDWVIGVGAYKDEFMEAPRRIETAAMHSNIMLVIILVISIGAAILIWMVTAKRITEPIIKLTDAAQKMSMGNLDIQIDVTSQDEIGSLAQAIKRMQKSLKMAIARMRKERQV